MGLENAFHPCNPYHYIFWLPFNGIPLREMQSAHLRSLAISSTLYKKMPLLWSRQCLTHRSTPTLPLRVTFRHKRSDFSSLTFRAASAAPVNSIR